MEEIQGNIKKNGKKIVTPKPHSVKEMYVFYKHKNPKAKIPYWMFKEVISRFNKKCADSVIFGQVFNFQSRLGYLLIKKIRRNYDKPVVDWGASKALKKELLSKGEKLWTSEDPTGEKWMVYYSDPWYLRWGWIKKRVCRVKNQTVYKFVPTANRSKIANDNSLSKLGNKGKLAYMNKLNPNLHLLYEDHIRTKLV